MTRNTYDISPAMVDRFRNHIAAASQAGDYSSAMNRKAVNEWLDEQGFCGKRPILSLASAFARELDEGKGRKGDPWQLRRLLELVDRDLEDALAVKSAARELLFSMKDTLDEINRPQE